MTGERKRVRGLMILGLCSSFALVPALSLVKGGGGSGRRLVGPASTDVSDPMDPAGPGGLAALLVSNAALSVALSSNAAAPVLAASPPVSPPVSSAASPPVSSPVSSAASPPVSSPPNAPIEVVTTLRTATSPTIPSTRVAPVVTVLTQQPVTAVPTTVPPRAVPVAPAKGGVASWLDTIPGGTCANNDAPMGAVLTVTNLAGVSVTCKVVSRGPFVAGRIVDLAKSTFAQLGSTSAGLLAVGVTW